MLQVRRVVIAIVISAAVITVVIITYCNTAFIKQVGQMKLIAVPATDIKGSEIYKTERWHRSQEL